MLLSSPKLPDNVPPRESINNVQDTASESNSELQVGEDPTHACTAVFCVDYETRDGSAKNGKDYHSLKGTLVSDSIYELHILVIIYQLYFSMLQQDNLVVPLLPAVILAQPKLDQYFS